MLNDINYQVIAVCFNDMLEKFTSDTSLEADEMSSLMEECFEDLVGNLREMYQKKIDSVKYREREYTRDD